MARHRHPERLVLALDDRLQRVLLDRPVKAGGGDHRRRILRLFGVDAPGDINSNRDEFLRTWGTTEGARDVVDFAAPSRAGDEGLVTWIRDGERLSGTAEEGYAQWQLVVQTNVSGILPSIHVPTLVVSRRDSHWAPPPLDDLLPHAQVVEVPGRDHALLSGDWRPPLAAFEAFIDSVSGASRNSIASC